MKSNIRIFSDNSISASGNVLPFSEFELCRDIKNKCITPVFGDYFVSQAENMLSEEIPLLPLSLYRDFSLTTVRSRFEKPHHRRRTILYYMTLAEAYERKGRFTDKIADVLWAILEESCWVIPAHYRNSVIDPKTNIPEIYSDDQIPGLDLYAANCCATVALTRHLLKNELDQISPIICKRIDHQVYMRGIRPFISHFFGWSGEKSGSCNNWVTNITSTILLATAVTAQDTSIREKVLDRAMHLLDNFTASYPDDGCCDEGPGYWGGAGGNYFDCLEIIDDMTGGRINVYDHPLVKNIGQYIKNFNIDADHYLNFSDAKPRIEHDGIFIMRYASKCNLRELYQFGQNLAYTNNINRYYFFGMAYRYYKNIISEYSASKTDVPAQTQLWYDNNKIAIFRQTEYTSQGLYLAVKGGNNHESHNHNDVGCIVVYADGKPLIVDPSHGSYDNGFFGPSRYKRWYMKSGYHSIPTVNGYEQLAGKDEYSSSNECFNAEENEVSMELQNAFPKEAGIIKMHRSASMKNGTVTVIDTVTAEKTSEICFNYVTINEPKIIGDNILDIGNGRSMSFICDRAELTIERIENTFLPYEDLNFRAVWGTDCLWRIVLKATAKEKQAIAVIK